jgi:hypothetical protein
MFERSNSLSGETFFIATNLIPCLYPKSQGEKTSVLGEFDRSQYRQLSPWDFVLSHQMNRPSRCGNIGPVLTTKERVSFFNGY